MGSLVEARNGGNPVVRVSDIYTVHSDKYPKVTHVKRIAAMTKEIWATVIVAIAQIIASILVAWWQISKTTQATENPEKNHERHKNGLPDKTFKYLSRMPLHIILPFMFYVGITIFFIHKQLPTKTILVFIGFWILLLLFQTFLFWVLKVVSFFASLILKHEGRLRCHETMLSGLTDKPCKEDGKCKIDV